ncbi:putative cyclin-dependent kinase F-2 [Sorghum bicolor]|uniref:putative cyclin-dependent kinase F-2 n=1 Tax=Sorghum bicolor TaxID=4558 RepID=UPI000B425A37|nr:putative cyclin-dependent kinase F-2 [Sorghum bicolor]|eukprot:XP_021321786.1 putative cyclin-dependent kinase F-2 [Sorghum bicolor]
MDLHVGPSLRAVMADRDGRPFTEAEARRVMRQLLAGAEAMHRHGVVHRDIKPENILVGAGAVKICNYGVAKSVAEKDPPQAFAGTMAYMLPFVVAAKDEDDEGKQLFKIFDVLGVPCKRVWEALKPQGFDFTSSYINLGDIREKIAMFIVSQIIEQNGKFHSILCKIDDSTKGDEA